MHVPVIALFGETEKGEYETAYYCQSLPQLVDFFGNPPGGSCGLHCAVQALLFNYQLVYFRVREEGYNINDYFIGLRLLENQNKFNNIIALCLPGVGDHNIIHIMLPFCQNHHSVIIMTESDLYDYLTTKQTIKDVY